MRRRARRIVVAPYRGFGRGNELLLRGRVLVEKRISPAAAGEPVWRSVLNTLRRFESDEVPGARIRASYRDAVVETVADREGHFQVRLQPTLIDQKQLWHEVTLQLVGDGTGATAHVLVPPPHAAFGIISDIDDTIVQTGATSLRTMIRTVIQNAAMRLPFEGVADLYRALHQDLNPLFYVSSSPWNLYDVLEQYKALNKIPHGPMFLQDYGIDEDTFIHDAHDVHKLREIQTILDFYPSLPFVLIGDSGQHDPEIYLRVIQANPSRIKAAFIRDVTGDLRDKAVTMIAGEAKTAGVEMLYVASSAEALEHARRLGLVSASWSGS
jgi:phosphatidate phosphatase APP1